MHILEKKITYSIEKGRTCSTEYIEEVNCSISSQYFKCYSLHPFLIRNKTVHHDGGVYTMKGEIYTP